MTSPTVERLKAELRSALSAVDGVRAVFLFGSVCRSTPARDVDVLVVYGWPLTPSSAASLRPLVQGAVTRAASLPADLVLFTESEAREPGLMDGLKPMRLVYAQPAA
jgi:predicted nucleotidyltransferase